MTDEELKQLCADLRLGVPDRPPRCCLTDRAAADEIERLAAEVDWLRSRSDFDRVENTHSNTPG